MKLEKMSFEEFWNLCQILLKKDDIIPNWSVDGNIIVQEYKILDVTAEEIKFEGYNPRLKKTLIHSVAKHEFQKLFPYWNDYKIGLLLRNEIREISHFSTYIIATMKYIENLLKNMKNKNIQKQWRSIWEKSVDANCTMISDFREGSQEFNNLIAKYPDDGMVYYEYAESFEYHKMYDEAQKYYQKAKELFPREEWQNIAQAGLDRIKYPQKEPSKSFETIYHNIHTIKYFNMHPSFKYMVIFSMAKSLEDKVMCLLTARTIIETIVLDYLNPYDEITKEVNLYHEINSLKGKFSASIIQKMHNIRLAGNAVVHFRPSQKSKDLSNDLKARMFDLYDIIKDFYEHK